MHVTRLAVFCLVIYFLAVNMTSAQEKTAWPDEAECRENPPTEELVRGWCIAIDRDKGNCLACHTLNIKPWPATLPLAGNIAPPLVAMAPRFPDTEALREQIADAPAFNPNTTMPPYQKHGLLTEAEIDRILQFILSL